MRIIRLFPLIALLVVSAIAFASGWAPAPADAKPSAAIRAMLAPPAGWDMNEEPVGSCASKGSTCLKGDAPHCCRGLRCVGYKCK